MLKIFVYLKLGQKQMFLNYFQSSPIDAVENKVIWEW